MVRLPGVPYEFDTRSKSLLKRKEFDTSEFRLLKIEEGEGNWAGTKPYQTNPNPIDVHPRPVQGCTISRSSHRQHPGEVRAALGRKA